MVVHLNRSGGSRGRTIGVRLSDTARAITGEVR